MESGGPTDSLSRAVCAPHEFQCSNRSCLAAVFVCDGDDDCGDGSDERGCADPACGPREFRCGGGDGGACIPERWVCDRQFDCEDRSDEAAELCGRAGPRATSAPATCAAAAQFACRSGECVHLGWRCDGDRDCKDKSDEADCRKPPPLRIAQSRGCATVRGRAASPRPNLFIYLFLAVLGLHFCARAFSSFGERGPLFIVVRGPLTIASSLVAEHRLQTRKLSSCRLTGLVAPWHVGSSQTRARTHVPCIGRQILNHCATSPCSTLILVMF